MAIKLHSRTPSYRPSQLPSRPSPRQALTAKGAFLGGVILLLIGGCAQETAKAPLPVTPPGVLAPTPAIVLPANAQYVCVTEAAGQRQQTVIEFSPKVAGLCLKHPEMGPCQ